jgi:hypothetical protein
MIGQISPVNVLDTLFPREAKLDDYTEDMWIEKFKPLCVKDSAPHHFDWCDEEDRDFLDNVNEHHVWTFVECDNDNYAILPGFRRVNRLFYYVTLAPWSDRDRDSIIYCRDDLD